MNSEISYRNILGRVMETEVEGWAAMSPLDPLKMIVSGLSASLGEIEERQNRVATQVLSLMPTLLGLEAHEARGPQLLFQFKSRSLIREALPLPRSMTMRPVKDGPVREVSFGADSILPFELHRAQFTRRADASLELQVEATVAGSLPYFEIFYIKGNNESFDAGELAQLELSSGSKIWNETELRACDHSVGLSASGAIRVYFRADASAAFDGRIRLSLSWSRANAQLPTGEIVANAFTGEICESREWFEFARIQGDAWEEIPLGERLMRVPDEVLLSTSNGGQQRLERIQEDHLRESLRRPEDLKTKYIYNSARHSLVFPAGHLLVNGVTAGLPLLLRQAALMTPASREGLSQEGFPWMGQAFDVEAIAGLHEGQRRENAAEFDARFQLALRDFHRRNGASCKRQLDLAHLRASLFGLDVGLRRVEIDSSPEELKFYLSRRSFDDAGAQTVEVLDPELRARVHERLSELVPLDQHWSVAPFQLKKIYCAVRRVGTRSSPEATLQLEKSLRAHFCQISSIDRAALKRLVGETSALSGDVSLLDEARGVYVDEITRRPGETFCPRFSIDGEELAHV